MKNFLIDIASLPFAIAVHVCIEGSIKLKDWKQKRIDKKRQDKCFNENPQLRRWNEC